MPELIALRRGEPYFDGRGLGTLRFNEYIEQLTNQVNETTSTTEEINTQVSSSQQLLSQLTDLLRKQEVVVPTTTDITAKPFEIIICNNTATIDVTTPINPLEGDIFSVKRKDAKVNIIGPIDGETKKIINVKFAAPKLVFSGIEWSLI